MHQIAAQWPAKAMAQIFITGNTGIDALHYTVRNDFYHPETEWAKDSRLIAVTAHRRENLGEPMRDMFRAIRKIVEEFTDVKVIYPVHLNPQVRKIADEEFGGCDRIHLIEPLDVVEFHNLMKASYLIMTGKTCAGHARYNRTSGRCGSRNLKACRHENGGYLQRMQAASYRT